MSKDLEPITYESVRVPLDAIYQNDPAPTFIRPFHSTGFEALDKIFYALRVIGYLHPDVPAQDWVKTRFSDPLRQVNPAIGLPRNPPNIATLVETPIHEAAAQMEALIEEVTFYREIMSSVPVVHPTALPMHPYGPQMVWDKYVEPLIGKDDSVEFHALKSILQWTYAITIQAREARKGTPTSASLWRGSLKASNETDD